MSETFLPFTRPDVRDADIAAVVETLQSGWLATGPRTRAFETALEALLGRPVRTFNSGSITLAAALTLAGIKPGDEVLLPSLTWVASAWAVELVGATPVFVDVELTTRNLDLHAAARAITPRTRAILPVDLAGLPVARAPLYELAHAHGLTVVEDAAQSLGSRSQGRLVGSVGHYTSFSFHPNKNITTGEGGALVVRDAAEATRCERLRWLGAQRVDAERIEVEELGFKANLCDIASALGLSQLQRLEEVTQARRELARHYFDCFKAYPATQSLGLPLPDAADSTSSSEQSNWHMFQVLLPNLPNKPRARFMHELKQRGIGTGVHYWPVHRTTHYARHLRGHDPARLLPHTEQLGERLLTLPLFAQMVPSDVERVVQALDALLRA